MSRAIDWLAALGGLVAGVLATLAVAARIYGGRNESDATVSERRTAEVAELLKLKDEARDEVIRQRDVSREEIVKLRQEKQQLEEEIRTLKSRISGVESQIANIMVSISQTELCSIAATCPNRQLPKGAIK